MSRTYENRVLAAALAWARLTHQFGMDWAARNSTWQSEHISLDTGMMYGPMCRLGGFYGSVNA